MIQRVILTMTAGLAVFIIVILGALGAYVVLEGPASSQAVASQGSGRAVQTPPENGPSTQNGYSISPDEAGNIALSSVPRSTLLQQPRLVNFNGTVAYEVPLDRGYVYIDAASGQVIYNQGNGTQGRPGQRFRRPSR